MSYAQLKDHKLLIDADAPEPVPSMVKVVRAIELSQKKLLQWAGRSITLGSFIVDQSFEIAELLCIIAEILYAKVEGYSVGLVKYLSASGTGTGSGSATATVITPVDKSASD